MGTHEGLLFFKCYEAASSEQTQNASHLFCAVKDQPYKHKTGRHAAPCLKHRNPRCTVCAVLTEVCHSEGCLCQCITTACTASRVASA
eukprot:XP_001707805.1 Hypothetical protein GL50803_90725 [Giardia lamblia ATCC 50803]